jgi:hypothetical protein
MINKAHFSWKRSFQLAEPERGWLAQDAGKSSLVRKSFLAK